MATTSTADGGSATAKPRYLQLADTLRGAILSGALPAGAPFPTEKRLCQTHGVSRFTVREALRRLEAEGLIARRRGSGSTILDAADRNRPAQQPLSNNGGVLHYGPDTHIRFTARGTGRLPRKIAAPLGEAAEGRWFRFRGVRTRKGDDLPISVTDAYVTADLADAVARIDPERSTIIRQLERHAGITVARVTQDIQAVPASAEIAAALHIPRRSACLRILRCYFDADARLLELSASHHPGDRFVHSMQIDVDHAKAEA